MMERGARTLAQAKINLSLHVLDKEPDGFHSIETVFLRLELGDDVRLHTTAKTRSLSCEAMRDQPQKENLAYRAAALYSEETGWPGGFRIEIRKEIPIGGGLGGGSADAAAVLRILNALAPKPLPADRLPGLAARLGSDVPFLASDFVMAFGSGRGEKLLELAPLPSREVRLFSPPFGVDTGEAYALLDAYRSTQPRAVPGLTAAMFGDWKSAAKNSVNDFEPVVRTRWPMIDALMALGERHGLFLRMSGSGSTVFEVLASTALRADGAADVDTLQIPEGTKVIATRTAKSVVPVELLD